MQRRSGTPLPGADSALPDPRRRQLLQALALALGAPAAARLTAGSASLAAALSWADSPAGAEAPAEVFSETQLEILRVICAHVIPATDTPGAAELGVHRFVDHQLAHVEDAEARDQACHVLDALDGQARERRDTGFAQLAYDDQRALLEDLEAERNGFGPGEKWPFKKLKDLVVFGYCTTETGATKLLAFDPVPGGFRGSIPLESVGRAWFS